MLAGLRIRLGPVGSAREPTGPPSFTRLLHAHASRTDSPIDLNNAAVREYRRRMAGSTGGWILGNCQSDFARSLTKEGRDIAASTVEVVDATLTAARVDAGDIGVVHVANAVDGIEVQVSSSAAPKACDHGC